MPVRRGRSPRTSASTEKDSVVGESIAASAISRSSESPQLTSPTYATGSALRPSDESSGRGAPQLRPLHVPARAPSDAVPDTFRPLSNWSKARACVCRESVDDQDVDREHRDRPPRVDRHEQQLADRIQPGDADAEPARELTA